MMWTVCRRTACALLFLAAGSMCGPTCAPVCGGDWPQFRGPHGNGSADETGLPLTWSSSEHIRWRAPLPGPGNSSPIVVGDRVFVTCAEDEGRKRNLLCFDRDSGEQLWVRSVAHADVEETHKTNPYEGATPASDGKVVVVWHSSAGMVCYDLAGEQVWQRDLGDFRHIWGYGSSPILHEGKVIQLCGPGEGTFLAALDLKTGETLWETPEPGGSAGDKGKYIGTWGTPVVISVDGQDQILCNMPSRVVAYNPADGQPLWWVNGLSSERGDLAYTSPMVGEGVAIAMGGFGGPAFAYRLGGSGDVTDANRLWHDDRQWNPQRIGSGIIIGKHLFMANADDQGSIECLDVETGKPTWTVRRTSEGAHWGSMIHVDGRLYVTGQRGVTRVLAPNPEQYESLAENDLGEHTNSTPAASNGQFFLRTFEHLYCVDE